MATVNGNIQGQINPTVTTINHHVDQDIWIKDLETGRERQVNLVDTDFPVRPGHILRLTYDEKTERVERLLNEETSQLSFGNGVVNQASVNKYLADAKGGYFVVAGLMIPFINMLVGIIALVVLLKTTPVQLGWTEVPGARKDRLVTIVSGFALFAFSYYFFGTVIAGDSHEGFLSKSFSVCGVFASAYFFLRSHPRPFIAAAALVESRARLHDELIARNDSTKL